ESLLAVLMSICLPCVLSLCAVVLDAAGVAACVVGLAALLVSCAWTTRGTAANAMTAAPVRRRRSADMDCLLERGKGNIALTVSSPATLSRRFSGPWRRMRDAWRAGTQADSAHIRRDNSASAPTANIGDPAPVARLAPRAGAAARCGLGDGAMRSSKSPARSPRLTP